jgi:hypothetical protein
MKKKAIILAGILIISSIFMISAGANYSQTISQNPCPGSYSQEHADDTFFVFTDVPTNPTGDGTLTVKIKGDYDGYDYERVGVVVEGNFLGFVPESGYYDDCLCEFFTREFTVTQKQLRDWAMDGKIEIALVQGYGYDGQHDVNCFCGPEDYCSSSCGDQVCGNIHVVTLEYTGGKKSLPMDWIIKKFGLGKEK